MVCLSKPYPFKFFKGCLPQVLLGPFLNTLSHIIFYWLLYRWIKRKKLFWSLFCAHWDEVWNSWEKKQVLLSLYHWHLYTLEAAIKSVLQKKVFLKISQNSQENTCAQCHRKTPITRGWEVQRNLFCTSVNCTTLLEARHTLTKNLRGDATKVNSYSNHKIV